MLNKNELKQLRNEIVLNSVFLKDYKNSLGINENKVCSFFDGYMEYLCELSYNKNGNELEYNEFLKRYDTIENLWNYYNIFINDPLSKEGAENE